MRQTEVIDELRFHLIEEIACADAEEISMLTCIHKKSDLLHIFYSANIIIYIGTAIIFAAVINGMNDETVLQQFS